MTPQYQALIYLFLLFTTFAFVIYLITRVIKLYHVGVLKLF